MKKSIKAVLFGMLLVPFASLAISLASPVMSQPAYAASTCDPKKPSISQGANCAKGDDQSTDLFGKDGLFSTITNAALFLIGAVSVIMLIYGGIRYTISGGDSAAVTAAKNTILYAIVGIVVAILAYAIVNWVIGTLV